MMFIVYTLKDYLMKIYFKSFEASSLNSVMCLTTVLFFPMRFALDDVGCLLHSFITLTPSYL